jgi:ClpP class serine protease
MSKFHDQMKQLKAEEREYTTLAFKRSMDKIESATKGLRDTLSGFSTLIENNNIKEKIDDTKIRDTINAKA